MITKNQLVDSIARKLDLEKINVQERVTIFCFPKKNDENFRKKFLEVEQEVKKISKEIDLKIIEEGEIDHVKSITFSTES
jgi:hypothetical protein